MRKFFAESVASRLGGLAAALAALMVSTFVALAQDRPQSAPGTPVVLVPPKLLTPLPLGSGQAPTVPQSRPLPEGSAPRLRADKPLGKDARPSLVHGPRGISIDPLGEIDSDSVGVLDAKSGGFGVDMWLGSSTDLVARLFDRIVQPAALPGARTLARRLLLSAARPPQGKMVRPNGGSAPSFLARRLQVLLALGDVNSAKALLREVPVHVEERAVELARLNTAFLMNDKSGACGEARAGVAKYDSAPWRKAMVFCQFLAGESAGAYIGADLLREQGVKDDTFFALASMLGGDTEVLFTVPAKLEPLHLAMMRVAQIQITDTFIDSAEMVALRTIAFSPNATLDARLAAAERAEAVGVLKAQSLAQIYGAVTFAPGDISTALSNSDALSGPRGRALLYHAVRAQKVPLAQAEVLAKTFALARTQNRLATTVRAFLPLLEGIKPTQDLAWFATEAARAFYFVGNLELAGRWASLAQRALPAQTIPNSVTAGLPSSAASAPVQPIVNANDGKARATSAVLAKVKLWPFMALTAAGASRKPAAKPSTVGSRGSGAEGLNLVLPVGSVAAPVEASTGGPTAAPASEIEQESLVKKAMASPKPEFNSAMFSQWRKAHATGSENDALVHGALLLTLLDALGMDVPPQAWLETVGSARELGALPPPGLLAALDRSAKEDRVGETVLLVLAVLEADAPKNIHPLVIGPVVGALVRIGLVREARALALEVAYGAGL